MKEVARPQRVAKEIEALPPGVLDRGLAPSSSPNCLRDNPGFLQIFGWQIVYA